MGGEDKPLLCLGHILQLSIDPSTCLIKNDAWLNPSSLGFAEGFSDDFSTLKGIMGGLKTSYWYNNDYTKQQLGVIGNIYVNLGYIYSLVNNNDLATQDKKEKNDIVLFDFLKNLMSGISNTIGNVATFDLFSDPIDSAARIIDVNYADDQNREKAYNDAFTFELQNTKSVVRNYKFESSIFPDQTTIIAIGAQAKGGALGADVNTLIDFNQNLFDRVIPKKESPDIPPSTDPIKELEEKIKNLKDNINVIVSFINEIDPAWYKFGLGSGNYDVSNASKYNNALKDLINFFKTFIKNDNTNRAIIPTKLSIETDGIGGIVIGNLFKIPNELLPRGYRGGGAGPAKIAYGVTGLAHSIQNNDWVTNIDTQFIILDEPRGGISLIDMSNIKIVIEAAASNNTQKTKDAIAKIDPKQQPGPPAKDIPGNVSVDKVITAIQKKNYQLYANTNFGKNKLNIVGVRETNKAFNSPTTNYFSDYIVMFYYDENGKRNERIGWLTTAPGLTYEAQKFGGTGRTIMIQEGQYIDSYVRGLHQGKVDTLVQNKVQKYHRDESLNAVYNSVKIEGGVFGTNIHPSGQYGADNPKKRIDNWSAGCQVFRSYDDYLWMMQAVRNQIDKTKYKSFTYTLLNIKDL
jgi:hypothetical protein